MQQITVDLEDNLLAFIDRYAEGDRVSYIQNLLRDYRTSKLNQEIRVALEADRENLEYQSKIALWDCVVGDGLQTNTNLSLGESIVAFREKHNISKMDIDPDEIWGDIRDV